MAFYYHKDVVMTVYFYRTMWWKTKSVWLLLWICPGIYHERVIFMFWLFISSLFKNNICVYLCVCVIHVHVCAVAQSCLTFCDLMDCSPPGSSVHAIFQARILECVAQLFFRYEIPTLKLYKLFVNMYICKLLQLFPILILIPPPSPLFVKVVE